MERRTQDEQIENLQEEDLFDLPINAESGHIIKQLPQEEFDFCSISKESEMCSADQVFFQGQILPLYQSIYSITSNTSLSRSESMSTQSSNGFSSGGSSRSSSVRSHQSSTTENGGGSSKSTPIYKPRTPNNVNSHPSPKPKMKISSIKKQNMHSRSKKSTMWSLFRPGLVKTPEIVLDDLKKRSRNNSNKSFQKCKSFESNNSENSTRLKAEMKKKQGIFEIKGSLFGSCKCSSNAVDTIDSRIVTIKRSVLEKDEFSHEEKKGTKQQEQGKQSVSHNRTFEWLRQLSLDSTSTVRNDA